MSEPTGGLHYIHERIDQLIHQTALEVGLLECKVHAALGDSRQQEKRMSLARERFWAADDAAAEKHGKSPRAR